MAKKKTTPKATADKPHGAEDADLLARVDAVMKYRPSAEAEILARIFDGEARTPWQAVPDDAFDPDVPAEHAARGDGRVTDEDLRRGADLLKVILDAFRGERAMLDRLDAAKSLLLDMPATKEERLSFFVDGVGRSILAMQKTFRDAQRFDEIRAGRGIERYGGLEQDQRNVAWRLVHWLARYCDPRFEKLPIPQVRTTLLEAVKVLDKGKSDSGGASQVGAVAVACDLAIGVDAFDARAERDFGKRLAIARSRARKHTAG